MRQSIILIAFLLLCASGHAQEQYNNVKVGDILSINKEYNTPFNHLYFPKANFIIKRGAIANYKVLDGMKVQIEEVAEDATVRLIPLGGKKFFNKFSYVEANLEKALESGELKLLGTYKNTVTFNSEAK